MNKMRMFFLLVLCVVLGTGCISSNQELPPIPAAQLDVRESGGRIQRFEELSRFKNLPSCGKDCESGERVKISLEFDEVRFKTEILERVFVNSNEYDVYDYQDKPIPMDCFCGLDYVIFVSYKTVQTQTRYEISILNFKTGAQENFEFTFNHFKTEQEAECIYTALMPYIR